MTPEPVQTTLPSQIPGVYANFVLIQPGAMDATIAFGHQSGNDAPDWSIRVTMSWEELKFLDAVIRNHLEAYESTFGEVRDVISRAQENTAAQQKEATDQSEEAEGLDG